MKHIRPGLYRDKNLLLVYGVTLMVILGVSSVMPALPLLMERFQVEAGGVGWVMSAFTLPGVFFALAAAVLADRLGRKRVLVGALLVFGVFGTACAFAESYSQLLFFRFLQGMGAGPLGVLNATILGDLYEGRERLAAMGYLAAVMAFGTAFFPAAGGWLAAIHWHYPFFLPVLALPLALAIGLFLDNPEPGRGEAFGDYLRAALRTVSEGRVLLVFSMSLLTFLVLYGPYVTYLPILMAHKFGSTPARIGEMALFSSAAMGLASSQAGRLAERFGLRRLMLFAVALYFTSMALMPLAPSSFLLAVPLALFGAGQGFYLPALLTMLAELAPTERRAVIMAVNGMILRLGQTLAPLLMGLVYSLGGLDHVFNAGAAICVLLFVLGLRLRKQ